jgi:hypothetical protein
MARAAPSPKPTFTRCGSAPEPAVSTGVRPHAALREAMLPDRIKIPAKPLPAAATEIVVRAGRRRAGARHVAQGHNAAHGGIAWHSGVDGWWGGRSRRVGCRSGVDGRRGIDRRGIEGRGIASQGGAATAAVLLETALDHAIEATRDVAAAICVLLHGSPLAIVIVPALVPAALGLNTSVTVRLKPRGSTIGMRPDRARPAAAFRRMAGRSTNSGSALPSGANSLYRLEQ